MILLSSHNFMVYYIFKHSEPYNKNLQKMTTPRSQVVSIYLENQINAASRQLQSGLVSMDGAYDYNDHARDFVESCKAELCRVGDALKAIGNEIESNLRDLLFRASNQAEENKTCPSATIAIIKTEAQALFNRSLDFYSQTQVDADEFLRIANMADLKLNEYGFNAGLHAMSERQFQGCYP